MLEQHCGHVQHLGSRGSAPAPRRTDLLAVAGMAVLMMAWATAARAQPSEAASSAAQPASAPQQAASALRLEPVSVTARRRVEDIRDVPVVMSVFDASQIDRRDLRTVEAMSAATPGLTVTRGNSGSGADFRLRGIGTTFSSIGIEQSLAVLVDGAYYGQGRIIDEGFDDLKRVELLKGPQALFFGKNSTAGALSLTSQDPGPDVELKVRTGYEFAAREAKAAFVASGPVSPALGLRLALSGRRMGGGYVRNEAAAGTYTTVDAATGQPTAHDVPAPGDRDLPGYRSLFARLTAVYTPNSDLKLTLKANGGTQRSDSYTWSQRPWRCARPVSGAFPAESCGEGFDVQQNPIPADIAATREDLNRRGGQLYTLYRSSGATARVDYTGAGFTLASVTNTQLLRFAAASDYDMSGLPAIYAGETNTQRAFSQEFRLLTQWQAPVNVLLGAYYQRTRLNFGQGALILGADNSAAATTERYMTLTKDSATRGETRALYAQAIWSASPTVEATAGARYTDETKRSYFVQPYVNPFFAPVYSMGQRIDSDQHFHNVSPEVTARWKPSQALMAYAAWKEGYKSGGFSNSGSQTALAPTVDTFAFRPETAKGVELGIKTSLLDQRLLLNVAAYRYRYADMQLEFFNAPTIALVTTNVGSATVHGLELDGELLPPGTRGLRLRASLQYNVARYRDFIGPCYAGQTIAQGCDRVGPAPTNALLQDLGGKPLAAAPRWTGSIGVEKERPLAGGMLLGVSADLAFSSRYSASPVGQPNAIQAGFGRLDAAVRLQSASRRSQVALVGKNLTNRFVVSYASDAPLTGTPAGAPTGTLADQTGIFQAPRTVELQFATSF